MGRIDVTSIDPYDLRRLAGIGNPFVNFGFIPAYNPAAELALARERIGLHFLVDARTGQARSRSNFGQAQDSLIACLIMCHARSPCLWLRSCPKLLLAVFSLFDEAFGVVTKQYCVGVLRLGNITAPRTVTKQILVGHVPAPGRTHNAGWFGVRIVLVTQDRIRLIEQWACMPAVRPLGDLSMPHNDSHLPSELHLQCNGTLAIQQPSAQLDGRVWCQPDNDWGFPKAFVTRAPVTRLRKSMLTGIFEVTQNALAIEMDYRQADFAKAHSPIFCLFLAWLRLDPWMVIIRHQRRKTRKKRDNDVRLAPIYRTECKHDVSAIPWGTA